MTQTTDNPAPKKPTRIAGEHWFELTATLSPSKTESFACWIESELAILEASLECFASARKLRTH